MTQPPSTTSLTNGMRAIQVLESIGRAAREHRAAIQSATDATTINHRISAAAQSLQTQLQELQRVKATGEAATVTPYCPAPGNPYCRCPDCRAIATSKRRY